jgi:type VI protein secretion system component VasF
VTSLDPSRRRRPRRRRWPKLVALLAAAVVVFLAGFGLGQALDDNPDPGPAVTTIQQLEPLPAVTETG